MAPLIDDLPRQTALVRPLSQARDSGLPARRLLIAAVSFGVLSVLALAVDLPLAAWFREHELPGELRRLVHLAEAFAWGGTVGLIVLAAALLDERRWRVVPRLAIMVLGGGVLANLLKLTLARLRPSAADLEAGVMETFVAWLPLAQGSLAQGSEALRYGYKLQSFPSGHTATAVGLAIGLSTLYPRGRWLFGALALLAALQRLEGNAHFLSDVLAGAAVACLAAAACLAHRPLRQWLARLEA